MEHLTKETLRNLLLNSRRSPKIEIIPVKYFMSLETLKENNGYIDKNNEKEQKFYNLLFNLKLPIGIGLYNKLYYLLKYLPNLKDKIEESDFKNLTKLFPENLKLYNKQILIDNDKEIKILYSKYKNNEDVKNFMLLYILFFNHFLYETYNIKGFKIKLMG